MKAQLYPYVGKLILQKDSDEYAIARQFEKLAMFTDVDQLTIPSRSNAHDI